VVRIHLLRITDPDYCSPWIQATADPGSRLLQTPDPGFWLIADLNSQPAEKLKNLILLFFFPLYHFCSPDPDPQTHRLNIELDL
jgi:hypothetical protein